MSDGTPFSVYGRMTARPGRRDELMALLRDAARAGGADGGLLDYSVNAALDEPDAVWVTERWTDKETHDRVTRSEPVVAATRRLRPLVAGAIDGTYGHAVHVSDHSGRS